MFKIHFADFIQVNKFVKIAQSYEQDIDIRSNHYVLDAKSQMGIYSLDLSKVLEVDMHALDDITADEFYSKVKDLGVVVED